MEAGNGMFGRIITIVSADQHRCVRIDAEKVRCSANSIDLLRGERWQTGSWETLLFTVILNAVDHYLWIIAILREYRMCEPAKLYRFIEKKKTIFVISIN